MRWTGSQVAASALAVLLGLACAKGAPGHPEETDGGRGPLFDAGRPVERDAGEPPPPPERDAGRPPRDAEPPVEDTGAPPVDAAPDAPEDSCANGSKDGFETGTDCGGPDCDPCALGGGCIEDTDCAQGLCEQGVCGCSADSDSDGTIDCDDACPMDPLRIALGDCGCVGAPNPTAAGAACDDGECPLNTQCDGSGSCGSAADCAKPDPSCGPLLTNAGHAYFVCVSQATWLGARAACMANPRFDLVRIDDLPEQTYFETIVASLTDDVWIGGSDQGTEGDWRWTAGNAQFWSGGSGGTLTSGMYAEWQSGEPSGDDCARYNRATLAWADTNCDTDMNYYVCESL